MRPVWGVLLLILSAVPAWAALGDVESSVNADMRMLRGQMRQEVHAGFRLHLITEPSGATIREYISPEGKVFGISWEGAFVPNMQQLLGTYFPYLQQYAQSQAGRHGGPLIIRRYDFVFSTSGHMGSYRGHAYVPSLVPANVTPEVVQ